jgi:excisionase family DNA binding protein
MHSIWAAAALSKLRGGCAAAGAAAGVVAMFTGVSPGISPKNYQGYHFKHLLETCAFRSIIRQNYSMSETPPPSATPSDHYSTLEVARLLGMAVRSVQMMVDRGELEAWKTPGGHRRISRESVQRWREARRAGLPRGTAAGGAGGGSGHAQRVLLIEDSKHFQNLVTLLLKQGFPGVDLHVADDGITGLAMVGQLQPEVLIVDILLPGIDGAALITSLRSHPQFSRMRLIVVTSLDEAQRAPYAFALQGVPVVHKPQMVTDLPPLLQAALAPATPTGAAASPPPLAAAAA